MAQLNSNQSRQGQWATVGLSLVNGSPSIPYPFTLLHISLKARLTKQRFERGQN
ncbi:MAG: hypothetical protein RIG66_28505 [Coleofasciculus sp. E2-BRE-01]